MRDQSPAQVDKLWPRGLGKMTDRKHRLSRGDVVPRLKGLLVKKWEQLFQDMGRGSEGEAATHNDTVGFPELLDAFNFSLFLLLAGPAHSTSARHVMQFHAKRLERVEGLADELEKQIVWRESHLQHSGFQSGEVTNAGPYRLMNSLYLPAL